MKGLLIACSVGLGLASGSAFAADLPPVTAAPDVGASAPLPPAAVAVAPTPPVYSWTGCFINAGGGYGMWKQDHYGEELSPSTPLTPTVSAGGERLVGTVGAGCDYQAGSRWLIGAFGDYSLTSNVYGGYFEESYWGWTGKETEQGAWALGGRIGYLLTPKLLTYVSVGYTRAHLDQVDLLTDADPRVAPAACGGGPCFIPAYSDGGWFIGSGTEYALWDLIPIPGLFWRIDYRYARYSSADVPILTSTGAPLAATCTGVGAVACDEHFQKNLQTVTSGLVWRFNVDGPAIASAFADDRRVTAAPGVWASAPPAPAYRWTGCYINAGVGYGMLEQDHYTNYTSPLFTGSTGGEGWLGTVGAGCDYQVGSRWVFGAFGNYDFMNLSGSFKDPLTGYIGTQTGSQAWAAGIRIGYLITPDLLTYIIGGFPQARFDQINLLPPTPSSPPIPYYYPAHTYVYGFFWGAGTEYALGDIVPVNGLFWRTEYRYADYNSADLLLMEAGQSPSVCAHCPLYVNKDVQTVTSGFVWRFNFGGP